MAFVTKTWKDRLVEYAGRRKLKNVATGEEILMDVSRSEGTVNQVGDAFNATNMNNLEQRIKTEFDNVNSSLTDSDTSESFNFGSLNGVRGFFTNPSKADDSFIPFKSVPELEQLTVKSNERNKTVINANGYSNILIFDYATQWTFSSVNNGNIVFIHKFSCFSSDGSGAGNASLVLLSNVTLDSITVTRSGSGTGHLKTPIVYGF